MNQSIDELRRNYEAAENDLQEVLQRRDQFYAKHTSFHDADVVRAVTGQVVEAEAMDERAQIEQEHEAKLKQRNDARRRFQEANRQQ